MISVEIIRFQTVPAFSTGARPALPPAPAEHQIAGEGPMDFLQLLTDEAPENGLFEPGL
jgi:hypothetical protein